MELMYLNFQYFFDAYPPLIKSGTFWTMLIASLLGIAIAFLIKYSVFWKPIKMFKGSDKYKKALFNKLYEITMTFGVVNFLLLFFRKARVPYFQIRFVMILFWIIILVWLSTVLQQYLMKIPAKRIEDAKRREYEKYLK